MNAREISEIRRHFRPDRSNIGRVRGVFVNAEGKVSEVFTQSLELVGEAEREAVLTLLKKALGGTVGRNLLNVDFPTRAVSSDTRHADLMKLRDTGLSDDTALQAVIRRATESLDLEGAYLLLFAEDVYDVFRKDKNGDEETESTEQYRYIVAAACPVKKEDSALTFEGGLKNAAGMVRVLVPEVGFLFPAFDDRTTNLYNALYYTRSTETSHAPFADAVLGVTLPLPAGVQKNTLDEVINETIGEDCSLSVVRAVKGGVRALIEQHKATRDPDPLYIGKNELTGILESTGLPTERTQAFAEGFDRAFGGNAELPPANLIGRNTFEVKTPSVTVRCDPDTCDLIETRVIDGRKCIVIHTDGDVVLNGITIHIGDD